MKKLKRNESGIWVMVAVGDEFIHPDANICNSGIGKINAAIAVQHIIDTEQPKLIVLMGMAGSSRFKYGQIVNPTSWVQRDMNLTEFMGSKYVVPFSDDDPILRYGRRDERYPDAICGSGDGFIRNTTEGIWDCVEMEGFAIAYACREAGVPFIAYKFISDPASANTQDHEWEASLDEARAALHGVYENMEK
ncbi:MAG: hypothetical protein FWG80_01340 [Alphaproteobacteria bacterium]|nr:hypothetical protein [Alphaproteobacteria bacterium]